MTCRKMIMVIAILLLISVLNAGAEDKFGVEVYSGAKYDAAISKNVSESFSINAACYRTNDNVAKVVEFYKIQSGLEFMGGGEESAMFKKGDVDITIQNPWIDMESGMMMKDTLISIVKH
jgi:hypothetical protein